MLFIYLSVLFFYDFFLPNQLNKFIESRVKLEVQEWCRPFRIYLHTVPEIREGEVFDHDFVLKCIASFGTVKVAAGNGIFVHGHIEFNFVVMAAI